MTEHRVTAHVEGREPVEQRMSIPGLEGLSVRGFVLADDRSWCLVLDTVAAERESDD